MSIYDVLIGDAAIIPYDYVVVCKHIQFEHAFCKVFSVVHHSKMFPIIHFSRSGIQAKQAQADELIARLIGGPGGRKEGLRVKKNCRV